MERPNILLIHTDQQRWDALGANGNTEIKTPNLDNLAQKGVNFDHYFVQSPVCMSSRVSYLTGLYPSTLGIYRNGIPVPEDVATLPRMLSNYGYISANIGKLHFLNHANRDHRDRHPGYGFDHLEISDEPGCYEDAYRAWVRRKDPSQLDYISVGLPPAAEDWYKFMNIDDGIKHPEERFAHKAVPFPGGKEFAHSAFVAEQTIEFIKKHQDDSFLCVAGFYSPHSPWVVPQDFLDLYNPEELTIPELPEDAISESIEGSFTKEGLRGARWGYYAMVSEVDHYVGRIMETLRELGLAENTIIVFTSDHGEYLGEHLRYGKGMPGHDCVSRVPCIIHWPEGIKRPGETVSGIVEAVDLVPTILDAAGIQVHYELQGKSLMPILEGATAAGKRTALLEGRGGRSIRSERYRYVINNDGDETLYDLHNDPGEYINLAHKAQYQQTLSEMRYLMLKHYIDIDRPKRPTWHY